MRVVDVRGLGGGRARGLRHGETFAGDIRTLCALRTHLACTISGLAEARLLELAEQHLPVLQRFDPELCAELLAIAEAAGATPAQLVVLNHYTDLRDLHRFEAKARADEAGGCTMVWARTPQGAVFGQTWDMHASAAPFVIMMRVDDVAGGDAWLLSLTGCLGMAGMNAARLAIGINNLTSTDARVGVVWSAVVRRALREADAAVARDGIERAELGSGHHYLVCDREQAFGIETSGTRRKVVFDSRDGASAYAHANHCLDGEIAACERVPEGSTTWERQTWIDADLERRAISGMDDLWQRLGSHEGYPRSICTNMATPEHPHAAATCAGIAMSPDRGAIWSVAGFTHAAQPSEFSVE
jgi:isopenicillin-N N-acyltransferase-like protein